jgi:hypothetical protein
MRQLAQNARITFRIQGVEETDGVSVPPLCRISRSLRQCLVQELSAILAFLATPSARGPGLRRKEGGGRRSEKRSLKFTTKTSSSGLPARMRMPVRSYRHGWDTLHAAVDDYAGGHGCGCDRQISEL